MTGSARTPVDNCGCLPLGIDEAHATGDVARLYKRLRDQAGYKTVPLLFRILAERCDCLEWAWQILEGGFVENRIAQIAVTPKAPSLALFPIADPIWIAAGIVGSERSDMRAVVASFNAANPRNLAAAIILRRAADRNAPIRPDWTSLPIAPLPITGSALPVPVPQDCLDDRQRALLHWLDTSAGTELDGLAPTLWRILVRWPTGLSLIACRIEPIWRDGTIAEHALEIERDARSSVQSVPYLPATPPDTATAEFVTAVADAFLAKLPKMIAVGAQVSTCLEGASDA